MNSIYKTYKPAGSGDGLFLRLKDGESVKLRVVSEPAVYTQEFGEGDEKKITTRYAWVVFNHNEKRSQVFSQGVSVFRQLAELVEDWGEPTDYDVTVRRTGEMLETRYSVTPAPKSIELSAEEKAECEKIDLLGAVKGNWLKDFEDGAEMPAPKKPEPDTVAEVPESDEETKALLDSIPF